MNGVDLKTIESGIILYNKNKIDATSHKIRLNNVAEAVQKKKGEDSGDQDFEIDDLDEAAIASGKGLFGQEVLDTVFELTDEIG